MPPVYKNFNHWRSFLQYFLSALMFHLPIRLLITVRPFCNNFVLHWGASVLSIRNTNHSSFECLLYTGTKQDIYNAFSSLLTVTAHHGMLNISSVDFLKPAPEELSISNKLGTGVSVSQRPVFWSRVFTIDFFFFFKFNLSSQAIVSFFLW